MEIDFISTVFFYVSGVNDVTPDAVRVCVCLYRPSLFIADLSAIKFLFKSKKDFIPYKFLGQIYYSLLIECLLLLPWPQLPVKLTVLGVNSDGNCYSIYLNAKLLSNYILAKCTSS